MFNVNHRYGWNPKNVGTFLGPSIPGRQSLVRLGEKVGPEQRQIRCLESEKIIHIDERGLKGVFEHKTKGAICRQSAGYCFTTVGLCLRIYRL